MAPPHNLNLFDLFTKKKMENALKRDRRVKRLQAEMTRRRGVKIAPYSTSLLLEENLTVENAADVICQHLDEIKQQKEAISKVPKVDYESSPPRTLRNESNSSNEQSRTFVNMLKSGSQTNQRTVDPKQQKEAIPKVPKDDYDSSPPRTLRNESNSSNEQSRTFANMLKSGSETNKRTVDPAVVTAVIQEMMPKLLPTIVEGVVASMQKD